MATEIVSKDKHGCNNKVGFIFNFYLLLLTDLICQAII